VANEQPRCKIKERSNGWVYRRCYGRTGLYRSGAKIEATHVASNYQYKTKSNDAGHTLAQLREGEYVLRATAPGFNPFEVKEIRLVARDIRRIDIGLTVGAVSTSVEGGHRSDRHRDRGSAYQRDAVQLRHQGTASCP